MPNYAPLPIVNNNSDIRQQWRVVEVAGEDAKRVIRWLKANPSFRDPRLQRYPRFHIYRKASHRAYQIHMTTKVFARMRKEVKIEKMYW